MVRIGPGGQQHAHQVLALPEDGSGHGGLAGVVHPPGVRTARAKGLTRGRALARHGWRNAAVPVVTVLGLSLTSMLVGAVVIERVFVIPGVGSMLVDAVAQRDLILVQDVVMVLVAMVLVVNFLVDVLADLIDPRVGSR